MGLNVVDEAEYKAYRTAMTSMLQRYSGDFRYDFHAEVLQSDSDHSTTKVFGIRFQTKRRGTASFQMAPIDKSKKALFEASVVKVTIVL